jgi:hypothetical protein
VFDTDDESTETCKVANIRAAFSAGYPVFGLKQENDGSISVNTDFMKLESEYDKKYHIIRVNKHSMNGLFSLECPAQFKHTRVSGRIIRTSQIRYVIIRGSQVLGITNPLEEKPYSSKIHISYIDEAKYNNKPLLAIAIGAYDKHHYREDCGCNYTKNILIYNNKVLVETDYLCDDEGFFEDSQVPENTGSFTFCGRKINLDAVR